MILSFWDRLIFSGYVKLPVTWRCLYLLMENWLKIVHDIVIICSDLKTLIHFKQHQPSINMRREWNQFGKGGQPILISLFDTELKHLDVSKNSGTPKSSILTGFSIINHPFWGTPIFGNIHLFLSPKKHQPTFGWRKRIDANIHASISDPSGATSCSTSFAVCWNSSTGASPATWQFFLFSEVVCDLGLGTHVLYFILGINNPASILTCIKNATNMLVNTYTHWNHCATDFEPPRLSPPPRGKQWADLGGFNPPIACWKLRK